MDVDGREENLDSGSTVAHGVETRDQSRMSDHCGGRVVGFMFTLFRSNFIGRASCGKWTVDTRRWHGLSEASEGSLE
jgi:hypothetical protein